MHAYTLKVNIAWQALILEIFFSIPSDISIFYLVSKVMCLITFGRQSAWPTHSCAESFFIFCALDPLLAVLRGPYAKPGIKPGFATCKASDITVLSLQTVC